MDIHQQTHLCMAKSRAAAIVQVCSAGMIALALSFPVTGPGDEQHGLFGVIAGPAAVPEPATLALLGVGLAAIGFLRRRKPN